MDSEPRTSSFKSTLIIVILILALAAALAFGYWSFTSRQDYKNSSDKKIAAAVAGALAAQKSSLQKQFDDQSKQPFKTYSGSSTYGSISFNYPKTWSAYVDETSTNEPINGYFHPNQLPGLQSGAAFALRVELVDTTYDQVMGQYASQIKSGSVTSSAYIPPKVAGVANVLPGSRLSGAINQNQVGSMVVMKVRDKTLQIYTESNDYLNDFNNIILPSLSFVP